MASAIQSNPLLTFKGIATHAGHTYNASSTAEIKTIHESQVIQMSNVRRALGQAGFDSIEVSVGDTPACSVVDRFERPITEIRPGTNVFYDIRQVNLGSCNEEDIAFAVACPIISKNLERKELVVYGGGATLSKEGQVLNNGKVIYGLVALPKGKWGRTPCVPDVVVSSLSQEHGIIKGPPAFVEEANIGDTLLVLPVHVCMTAQCHKHYRTYFGERHQTIHA